MKNNDGFTPSRLAYIGGHMKAVQVMRTLQSEDETEHMAKRSLAEAARQVNHRKSHKVPCIIYIYKMHWLYQPFFFSFFKFNILV